MDLPQTYARTYTIRLPAAPNAASRTGVQGSPRLQASSPNGFAATASLHQSPSRIDDRDGLPVFPMPAMPRIPENAVIDDNYFGSPGFKQATSPTASNGRFGTPPATTFDRDNGTVISIADSALDLHHEIAQAVQRAVAVHHQSWTATLAASESEWQRSKEEAVARLKAQHESALAAERSAWEAERKLLTVGKDEQMASLNDELARLKAARDEEVRKSASLAQSLEKLRSETVPVATHRSAVLALELKLKARERTHEEALKSARTTQEQAMARAHVLVKMSEDRVLVQVSQRESELKMQLEQLQRDARAEVDTVSVAGCRSPCGVSDDDGDELHALSMITIEI